MSPIIDLQRRLVEVGRLRMGHQVAAGNGRRPAKLEHWRITSRDQARLLAAAELYGGTVQPWAERDGEFELFTKTSELPIMLIPGQTLSAWYELWSGGGCQRRCDGEREILSEGPCICDTEKGDRKCKPTTRLSVMLPDIPGLGVYRLESHGFYAAVELAGTAQMLEQATARGQLFPARLRIDQRSKVEGGKTTRYAVPVIDIDVTVRQALTGARPAEAAVAAVPVAGELPPARGFTPIASTGVTLEAGLAAVSREAQPRAGNGRQAAALGPAPDLFDRPAGPIPVADEPVFETREPAVINDAQRRLLWTTVRLCGVAEEELRRVVLGVTGQESTKLIPRSRFDQVLERIQALAEASSAPAVGPTENGPPRGADSVVEGGSPAVTPGWAASYRVPSGTYGPQRPGGALTLAEIHGLGDEGVRYLRMLLRRLQSPPEYVDAVRAYCAEALPDAFAELVGAGAAS